MQSAADECRLCVLCARDDRRQTDWEIVCALGSMFSEVYVCVCAFRFPSNSLSSTVHSNARTKRRKGDSNGEKYFQTILSPPHLVSPSSPLRLPLKTTRPLTCDTLSPWLGLHDPLVTIRYDHGMSFLSQHRFLVPNDFVSSPHSVVSSTRIDPTSTMDWDCIPKGD